MDEIVYHCPDCGCTVVMKVADSDKNDADAAIVSFNAWLSRQGWREVKHGFLGMFKKVVCNKCQMKY